MRRPTRRRCTGQRGSVSVFVVIMVPALLAAAGLVLDGGRQLEARRSAQGAAQAAARAAAQGSDEEVIQGVIDPDQALGRAQAELALHGASGSAQLVDGVVVVTVTASVDYLILPGGKAITETATADPQEGVHGAGFVSGGGKSRRANGARG